MLNHINNILTEILISLLLLLPPRSSQSVWRLHKIKIHTSIILYKNVTAFISKYCNYHVFALYSRGQGLTLLKIHCEFSQHL